MFNTKKVATVAFETTFNVFTLCLQVPKRYLRVLLPMCGGGSLRFAILTMSKSIPGRFTPCAISSTSAPAA